MPEAWRAPSGVGLHPTPRGVPQGPVPTRQEGGGAWDLLLACVAVYIATAVGRVHQLFPVLEVFKPALLASVLAITLYLLQQSGRRRMGQLRSPSTSCLLGLLLWCALSVPAALHQGLAFQTWTDFARTIVMCLVLAGSIRTVRDVERLGLVYYGVTVLYTAVVLSRFELGADNWRLSSLYYYDANDFATLTVTAMPFGLYFVLARRNVLVRLTALAGLGVLAMGLINSGSRGGFLALLAVGTFVLFRLTTVPARSRVAGLIVIVAVTLTTASDQYWTQMQTIINPKKDYNLTSEEGRVKIWERGIGYMIRRPLTGVGGGNFQFAEGTISEFAYLQERGRGVRWGAAHNSFVQIGAELGIPGLLLFVGLIANALAALRRAARRFLEAGPAAIDASRLAQCLMAALVAFVVGGFFLSLAYADLVYTLAAFSIGLSKIARTTHHA